MVAIRRVYIPTILNGQVFGGMSVDISVQCSTCRNWTDGLSCRAFPDGIPEDILTGEFDHTETHGDDSGILYDPIADA